MNLLDTTQSLLQGIAIGHLTLLPHPCHPHLVFSAGQETVWPSCYTLPPVFSLGSLV
jgi:hypothetical protein